MPSSWPMPITTGLRHGGDLVNSALFLMILRTKDIGTLLLGNPATDLKVKQYLKEVTAEQLQARITPKQATPLFLDKLLLLSRHLEKRLFLPSLTPSNFHYCQGSSIL